MTRPVVNVDEAEGFPMAPEGGSDRYGAFLQPLGEGVGLKKLGAMVTIVEPGKRAFPFHCHHANDEMFVVLSGSGEVRIGGETHPIRTGDVIGCPAGGRETAHQIVNSGAEPLKYLAISSKNDPDICEYPDSDKISLIAIGDGNSFFTANLRQVIRAADQADYWEGEA